MDVAKTIRTAWSSKFNYQSISNFMRHISVGDKVQLRSGSPVMMVKSVELIGKDSFVHCQWWSVSKHMYENETFYKQQLDILPEGPACD